MERDNDDDMCMPCASNNVTDIKQQAYDVTSPVQVALVEPVTVELRSTKN